MSRVEKSQTVKATITKLERKPQTVKVKVTKLERKPQTVKVKLLQADKEWESVKQLRADIATLERAEKILEGRGLGSDELHAAIYELRQSLPDDPAELELIG